MGRFQIVETPQALPGSCMLTGKSDDEYYVDTGIDFPFHGAVYIGSSALEEIISQIGWIAPVEAKALQETVDRLEALLVQQTIRNDKLERGLNELRSADFSFGAAPNSRPDFSGSPDVPLPFDEQSEGGSQGEGEDLGEGEGESSEPLDDERVGELRSDSGSERSSILGL